MAGFERSRDRRGKGGSRGGFSGRNSRGRKTFGDSSRGRGGFGGRGRRDSGRSRRDVQMTKVTCSSCGSECEVPFKPTSSKPVYCTDCFAKKGKGGSNGNSNKDLEIINEKLDKIMNFLNIG